jgi:DNA-binding GntR family transcriptional regulator
MAVSSRFVIGYNEAVNDPQGRAIDVSEDAPFATKSDLAYRRVRDLILAGKLLPGAVLPQAELARTIGMSTTPLREALRRLKQEGLVELDAHRDARVAPLDAAEARELLELRLALDPFAAALAAKRRTDDDLAAIADALDHLEALPRNPTAEQLATHRAFHATIHRASRNRLLIDTLHAVWDKTDRYRRHALEADRSAEEVDARAVEHRKMFEAVRDRDADRAADLVRRHVETSLGARSALRLDVERRHVDHLTEAL